MSAPIPRPYQEEAVETLLDYLCEEDGNPLIAAPTGVGKSLILNMFIRRSLEEDPSLRFIVCTHTKEIIGQNAQAMLDFWGRAPVGVYSSGLKQFNTHSGIVYAGIQSIYKKADEFGHIDCLICDEAHTISPKEETMWQSLMRGLRRINPDLRVCGFTATPFRMSMGTLVEGGLFSKIVVDYTKTDKINWFVDEGFMCPLISKKPCAEIDVTNVKMRAGEFDDVELEKVTDTDALNRAVVSECIRYGSNRNFWLVFATSIKHAEHLVERFRSSGISCEMIHGGTPEAERTYLIGDKGRKIEGAFQQGKFRCLVNVNVVGTGFDFPALDMVVLARAMQSVGLYLQFLGRLTRPYPGKTNGLVLDFGANIVRLGAFNAPILPLPRRKGDAVVGTAPVKACAVCGLYVHTRVMLCPECGYQFPENSKLEKTASQAEVMVKSSLTVQHEIMPVMVTHYASKMGKDVSWGEYVRVSYGSLTTTVSEYFFPEAPMEYKRKQFQQFWLQAGGRMPCPHNAENFLQRANSELKPPVRIHYTANTKHKDVVKKEYS